MSNLDRLAAEKYVLLTTFRRDGRAVPTPVWVVRDGDALAVWTVRDSGKVKRIRRDGKVTVAPCDVRGRPHGEATAGHATIAAAPAEVDRVRGLIRRKYAVLGGWSCSAAGSGAALRARSPSASPSQPGHPDQRSPGQAAQESASGWYSPRLWSATAAPTRVAGIGSASRHSRTASVRTGRGTRIDMVQCGTQAPGR